MSSPKIDEQDSSAQLAQPTQTAPIKKKCLFCKNETTPAYTDIQSLRKFISERDKILPKLRTGSCSKHQRGLTLQIKYARHLALLSFTPKV
ncbi:30S ribosomal protein S18 [Candidatus Daviesbacteria bacterium RIFCSPLOWO2_01_FULL_39_12]|uniref:30S ribosomal protein S18 n=1 Tax=Candidatus Daviesbacteria bacterium RIFCSPLOWO2_01_FULL_39_12 TaxID=1797785 RepID=A0A1F5KTF1_9BACT|nr:MAG: 30S ribosomal protein S18 [Candidatus Daviesbacteria bacterium RIFCSPHIGHO2_02_FULL_39_8]OGE44207.1 MAG: 30S ribosomal protein S18 [Candidatus Daviesbacteria bacterium RIFCSPLOWO2_01_FULL_39_12]